MSRSQYDRKGILKKKTPPGELDSRHLSELLGSGINSAATRAAGLYSESRPSKIADLLNWQSATRIHFGNTLVIRYRNHAGHFNGYCRLKPDNPRKSKGKKIKYEAPVGEPAHTYFPPNTIDALRDVDQPLIITEGEKKAIKANLEGFPTIGISGVWSWQMKREPGGHGRRKGKRRLIDDLEAIEWSGRKVYIVFDSDAATNPNIEWAEWRLAKCLQEKGAIVKIVRLPQGEAGDNGEPAKVGLDDFLKANSPEDLKNLTRKSKEPRPPRKRNDVGVMNVATAHKVLDGLGDALYKSIEAAHSDECIQALATLLNKAPPEYLRVKNALRTGGGKLTEFDEIVRAVARLQKAQRAQPTTPQADEGEIQEVIARLDELGDPTSRDFSVLRRLMELGIECEEAWSLVAEKPSFATQGRDYFDSTWDNAGSQRKRRGGSGGNKSQATVMVSLAADFELWHDPDGEAFATVPVGEHRQNMPVKSKILQRCLQRRFYEATGRPVPSEALREALGVLEGKALFDGPVHPVHVRLANVRAAFTSIWRMSSGRSWRFDRLDGE